MAESFKSKRAFFPRGEQRKFILTAKEMLNLTWELLAKTLKISTRNLTDWKNEKISMPFSVVKNISRITGLKIPKKIKLKDKFWYVRNGAKKGGLAVYKKYGVVGGDQGRRKEKWHEWWEKEGKYKKYKILEPLPFKKPKHSEELAEFVGIMLGDGGISKRQLTVTLNRVTDKEYFKFVGKLVEKLFDIYFGIYKNRKYLADDLVISRTGIVKYCVKTLGLKIGNKVKNQIDIPEWIKNNKKYKIACLRGLIDTDGSIIFHKYESSGISYCYKKISYCSRSFPLLKSAGNILRELSIKHRFTNNGYEIRIESQRELARYFSLVGSHNPKHLKRYKNKL